MNDCCNYSYIHQYFFTNNVQDQGLRFEAPNLQCQLEAFLGAGIPAFLHRVCDYNIRKTVIDSIRGRGDGGRTS